MSGLLASLPHWVNSLICLLLAAASGSACWFLVKKADPWLERRAESNGWFIVPSLLCVAARFPTGFSAIVFSLLTVDFLWRAIMK